MQNWSNLFGQVGPRRTAERFGAPWHAVRSCAPYSDGWCPTSNAQPRPFACSLRFVNLPSPADTARSKERTVRNPQPPVQLPQPRNEEWEWQIDAACRSMPIAMFFSPTGPSRFGSDRGRSQRQTHMRTVPPHRALLAARARLRGTVRHLGRAHRHPTKSMEGHSHCARAHPSGTETHHRAAPTPVKKVTTS